jgi:glycosyltransferase involved in cell wall biosynthesis/LmbE family N-acetylglucosaminyl deacetylase
MHICFPSLTYPLNDEPASGVGSQVRLLAQALKETGNAISVIDFSQNAAINDDHGVAVHRVPPTRFHWLVFKALFIGKSLALPVRELENSFAVWRAVREIHKSRRIDVIEGTETGMLFLALWWRQSPVIIRLHGEQYTFQKFTPGIKLTLGLRLTRALQRVALRRAKLLISPSYAHAAEVQSELHGAHPPIVVVPNNVSLNGLDRNGTDRSSRMILYAGRIERRKGITTFLRAAAQTKQAFPDARFVMAGDFHSTLPESEFRDIVRSCHLEKEVDFLGPVGKTALADLYKRSTIAVLPSHYETFGLAALEPMVFGAPVIATNSSALPEVVVSEVNGRLVPPGDESALARAMTELLGNSDLRAAMGKAAIRHAAKFDVRKVVSLTERLYRWSADKWSDPIHIFFSPHADDVALSCGGAIQSLVNRGKTAQVVTVFSGDSEKQPSAFARHLHRKWHTIEAAARERRQEDREALRILGVNQATYWDYSEAPNRCTLNGQSLYTTYDEMHADLSRADQTLVDEISERISSANNWATGSVFYFPLSLGNHVDHQILFAAGRRLLAAGKQVRFYEDYPYAENYRLDARELNWLPEIIAVPMARKLRALAAYRSQLRGLGGSLQKARKRLRRFSHRFGNRAAERYWDLSIAGVNDNGSAAAARLPLERLAEAKRFSAFANFIRTFRRHDLGDVLPVGAGSCVDMGCGNGWRKDLIESRGYRWIGVDAHAAADIRSDLVALPLRSRSQTAVVAWQVLKYVEDPQKVFAEAARVLEPGGIFCGSVSFSGPIHNRTHFDLNATSLETLLRKSGFGDIKITQFGLGESRFVRWISQTASSEFSDDVMFCARKLARQ